MTIHDPDMPHGTVTFLFTDIEGSTTRWEHHPREMKTAVERHDAILREAMETQGGFVFRTEGDAFRAVFSYASQALDAAVRSQRAITSEPWPQRVAPIRVRMALHTGAVEIRDGDYVGSSLNRMARLLSAAHGGQTLLSLPTEQLVRDNLPPDVTLRDMGEHRLKDLIRSEHIFQLIVEGLPSEFPPLLTLDAHPNNLPRQTTPLVDREKEVQEICNLLRREEVALVTLTGPAGIGKTRLALQVGAESLDEYKQGVFFVDLAPISDPHLVLITIAQALDVQETANRSLLNTLKDYLNDKRLLLVLDNFEQVTSAAHLLEELLSSSRAGLDMVVTSREVLRLRSEYAYQVPSLGVPAPGQLLLVEQLSQYDAVKLFVERAQAAKSDFAINSDNASDVAEICYRLDGLPLAIELAAARVKMLPPGALLARLSQRLKILTGGPRDLPARQQTLRAAIEWSYGLLSPGEKQLFRRMAVFNGGRTLETLEAVCDYDGRLHLDVLEGVQSLLDKSLIQQREGSDEEPRFWMLQTIHEYASEMLRESGEVAALQKEHALCFMRLAEEAELQLIGERQAKWFRRLEEEHDNLRAALIWANEEGSVEASQVGLRLGGAVWRFWYTRGYLSEGRDHLQTVLARYDGASGGAQDRDEGRTQPTPRDLLVAKSKVLNGLGNIASHQGDYSDARKAFEASLVIRRELGDKQAIASSLGNLANTSYYVGDIGAARSLFEECLAIFREEKHDWGTAQSLNGLGLVLMEQGEYAPAQQLFEEGLSIKRRIGDEWGAGNILNNLALVLSLEGKHQQARSLYKECIALFRQLGDEMSIAEALDGLARLAAAEGRLDEAALLWGAVEAHSTSRASPLWKADEHKALVAAARSRAQALDWQRAWEHGRDMSMQEAVEYAMEWPSNL